MTKLGSNILIAKILLFVYALISNPIIAQTAVDFGTDGKPKHNIFSFRIQSWQDHFKHLKKGALLVDTKTRSLHYWDKMEQIIKSFQHLFP